MPRPVKCRRVCAMPRTKGFGPLPRAACGKEGPLTLSVDEYEARRLIDLEGMTQEQCAAQMEVARTTVQAVYDAARRKVADALVNGRRLVIEGGSYRLCPQAAGCCRRPHAAASHCRPGCADDTPCAPRREEKEKKL